MATKKDLEKLFGGLSKQTAAAEKSYEDYKYSAATSSAENIINGAQSSGLDEKRLDKVKTAINSGKSREDILNEAGIGKTELDSYLEAAGQKDYKAPSFIDGAIGFVKDIGKGLAKPARMVGETLAAGVNKDVRDAIDRDSRSLEDKYKAGEISYEKFKEDFDNLTGGQINFGYKAGESGLEKKGVAEQTVNALGQSVEAGATFAAGPGSAAGAILREGGKQAIGKAIGASLAYGAKEGIGTTAASLAGQALQGQQVTLESALKEYGSNALLGGVGEFGGSVVSGKVGSRINNKVGTSLDSKLRGMTDEELNTPGVLDQLNEAAKTSRTVADFNKKSEEVLSRVREQNAAATAAATPTPTPEVMQRQLPSGLRTVDDIDAEIQAVQDGTDESLFRTVASDGTDITDVATQYDTKINQLQNQIRDLEKQGRNGKIPEGEDPSTYTGDAEGRGKALDAAGKMQEELDALKAERDVAFEQLGGVSKTLDRQAAISKFQELQQERAQANQYYDQMGKEVDTDGLRAEGENLRNGVVPDEMRGPLKPAQNANDVIAFVSDIDPEDSTGLLTGAAEVSQERGFVNEKLSTLYTPEKYQAEAATINEQYALEKAAIEAMPEPVQEQRLMDLDERVLQQYDELDGRLAADAPEVQDVMARQEELDILEQELVSRVNDIQLSNVEAFRSVDREAVDGRIREIDQAVYLNDADANVVNAAQTVRQVQESGSTVAQEAPNNPAVDKAATQVTEDAAYSLLGNTGKSAGFGWAVGVPTKVLEKFGESGRRLAASLRDAVDFKERLDGEFDYRMSQWGDISKRGVNKENVAKALDGDEAALAGLNDNEQILHREIKDWFAEWADELDIPQEGQIKNYLPHIFEGKNFDDVEQALALMKAGKKDGKTLTDQQMADLNKTVSGINPSLLAYLESKNSYLAKDGFLKRREGVDGYSFDLEKILNIYQHGASNKLAYEPVVDLSNSMYDQFTKEQNQYIGSVVKNLQGSTDTVIEKAFDQAFQNIGIGGKGTFSRTSAKVRNTIYSATIGANVGSAIRNAQQMVNVFTEVGTEGVFAAAPRAVQALKKGSPMREMLYRNGVMSNRQTTYLQNGNGVKFRNKSQAALWGMFNTTETLNRATAFFAGYDKHLKANPGDTAGAEIAGAETARKTNFKFSAIDMPVAAQGDFAKNFLQMQTYNIQQAQYIKGLVGDVFYKNPDGKGFKMNGEAAQKIARFVGGNALFFGTVGAAVGMDWKEAVPFGSEIVSTLQGEPNAPRSPITQIIFGDGKANPGIVGTLSSATGAMFSGDWDQLGKDADALARSSARSLVPGGNQAIKTIEGLNSASTGLSTTGSGITDTIDKAMGGSGGNIRFTQGQDAWSKLKAGILGQYSTQQGRDWVQSGMNNIPTNLKIEGQNASEFIKGLPRAAQEQYVAYYSNKSQAQDTLEKQFGKRTEFTANAKRELQSGKISYNTFVSRMNEYNDAVAQSMNGYLQGNPKVPLRIQKDLQENMAIQIKPPSSYKPRANSPEKEAEDMALLEDDYNW